MGFRDWTRLALAILGMGCWTVAPCRTVLLETGQRTEGFHIQVEASDGPCEAQFSTGDGQTSLWGYYKFDYAQYQGSLKLLKGPCYLVMQEDGHLCLYMVKGNKYVWGTQKVAGPGCRLMLDDDGKIRVHDARDRVVWELKYKIHE